MFYEPDIDLSTLKPTLMAKLRTLISRIKEYVRGLLKWSGFNVPDVLTPDVAY